MNSIDPNLINEGDPVVIQDKEKNVARGIASFDNQGRILLTAFKVNIPFARWSNSARDGRGSYAVVKDIRIVGHEPPMELLSMDVVPRKKVGSDPT